MLLHVLWATGRDYKIDWEVSWIRELLDKANISYTIENVSAMNHIVPNALIVVNHNIPYVAYLYQYEQQGKPFGLIHLSDEYMKDDLRAYDFKMCQFVFRNYYNDNLEKHPKVKHFALGYKYQFWKDYTGLPSSKCKERSYDWSFAGGKRDNRKETLEYFEKDKTHNYRVVIEEGNSFNDPRTGLTTAEYRELMLSSKFVLSPIGNASVDCFRVYEALECGSIPMCLANSKLQPYLPSYWHKLFGEEPPFLYGQTCEEYKLKMDKLLTDQEAYEQKRLECIEFWNKYKQQLSELIKNKIQLLI